MCTWRVLWDDGSEDHVTLIQDAPSAEEAVMRVKDDRPDGLAILKQISFVSWCGTRSHIGWLPEGWNPE